MNWKMKKNYFSIALYIKRINPSLQAYNDVKMLSILVYCFLDCKVFSKTTLNLFVILHSFLVSLFIIIIIFFLYRF